MRSKGVIWLNRCSVNTGRKKREDGEREGRKDKRTKGRKQEGRNYPIALEEIV